MHGKLNKKVCFFYTVCFLHTYPYEIPHCSIYLIITTSNSHASNGYAHIVRVVQYTGTSSSRQTSDFGQNRDRDRDHHRHRDLDLDLDLDLDDELKDEDFDANPTLPSSAHPPPESFATNISLLTERNVVSSLLSEEFDLRLSEGCELAYFRLFSACASGDASTVRDTVSQLSVAEMTQMNPLSDSEAYGLTPLHVARTIQCARLLLRAGVDIDVPGALGQTALHTHHDNANVVSFLLTQKATVDAKTRTNGSTPLQWAVAADQEQVVKELLVAGAGVNYQNFAGNTALHLVVSVRVAKVLVEKGARTDVVNLDGNMPVEDAALRAVDEAHYDVAMYLLELSKKQYMFVNNYFIDSEDFEIASESTTALEKYHDLKRRSSSGKKTGLNADDGSYQTAAREQGVQEGRKKGLKHRLESIRESCSGRDAESTAAKRWDLLKRSFLGLPADTSRSGERHPASAALGNQQKYGLNRPLTGRVDLKQRSRSKDSSVNDSDDFYSAFFEVTVKWKPKLAKKLLDKQRIFLFWENSNRVYRYNTSLLGTVPNSSSAMKQMILDNQTDLIAHPVVQFSLTARWILFTREVLFYEAAVHFVWLALIVLTTLTDSREIKLVKAVTTWDIVRDPFELLVLLANLMVCLLNLRFINLHLVHTKVSCMTAGKKMSLYDVLHSRQEYFYLATNLVLLVSQILRCFPDKTVYHNVADVCCAMITWRLFLRQIHFFECFESIGVPMSIIINMISINIIYFLILLTFLFGFSHSMYLLYRADASNVQYGSWQMSWVTLFFFLFNLDIDHVFSEKDETRRVASLVIIGFYMTLCVLVTMNLIIAVMTNTFERITNDSKKQWQLQRAKIILFYELYEIAFNYVIFRASSTAISSALETFLNVEYYPAGRTKYHVKEQLDGTVLIEMPQDYIDECLHFRESSATWTHRLRWCLFKTWKKRIRRSNSFIWPHKDKARSQERVPLKEAVEENLQGNPKPLVQIGQFTNPCVTRVDLRPKETCKGCEKVMASLERLSADQKLLFKQLNSPRKPSDARLNSQPTSTMRCASTSFDSEHR